MENKCDNYKPKLYELLIPSTSIYNNLCKSEDRTKIFIITVIRLIIYWFIYKKFIKNITEDNKLNMYGFIIITMIILNVISISIILGKTYKIKNAE